MLNDFVSVIANSFRVYIIYRFARIFFDIEQTEKKKQIILYSGFFVINSILFVFYHSPIVNILVNLVGVYVVFTVLYGGKISRKLFAVGTTYIFNMIADMIIAIPMNLSYEPGESVSMLSSVMSVVGMFILEIICEEFLKSKMKISFSDTIRFLSVPMCSILMNGIVMTQQIDNKVLIITLGMGTLLINIIVLYFYNQIQIQYEKDYHQKLLELQVHEYEMQLIQTQQMFKEIRSMKHEIKHFAGNIEGLLKFERREDIQEVLEEMKNKISQYDLISYSGNPILDSILNYICKKAKKNGAQMEISIKIPSDLRLKAIDMNIILGNLLENAIEAVSFISEKSIILRMMYEKGMLIIQIRNPYDGKVYKNGDNYLTRKENKNNHGIGLENVKAVVEKYSGSLYIEALETEFVVNILMKSEL